MGNRWQMPLLKPLPSLSSADQWGWIFSIYHFLSQDPWLGWVVFTPATQKFLLKGCLWSLGVIFTAVGQWNRTEVDWSLFLEPLLTLVFCFFFKKTYFSRKKRKIIQTEEMWTHGKSRLGRKNGRKWKWGKSLLSRRKNLDQQGKENSRRNSFNRSRLLSCFMLPSSLLLQAFLACLRETLDYDETW